MGSNIVTSLIIYRIYVAIVHNLGLFLFCACVSFVLVITYSLYKPFPNPTPTLPSYHAYPPPTLSPVTIQFAPSIRLSGYFFITTLHSNEPLNLFVRLKARKQIPIVMGIQLKLRLHDMLWQNNGWSCDIYQPIRFMYFIKTPKEVLGMCNQCRPKTKPFDRLGDLLTSDCAFRQYTLCLLNSIQSTVCATPLYNLKLKCLSLRSI